MLTLEAIHGAKDFKESEVDVPEWGGKVKVRTLSMAARYFISEVSLKANKTEVDSVKFAAGTLCHGVVEPKMGYEDAVKVVDSHASEPIQRIVDEVWRLSGLSESVAKNG